MSGTAWATQVTMLVMELLSGMLLSLLPSITGRTEPAYRMDVPDILAVPHNAPHFGANIVPSTKFLEDSTVPSIDCKSL